MAAHVLRIGNFEAGGACINVMGSPMVGCRFLLEAVHGNSRIGVHISDRDAVCLIRELEARIHASVFDEVDKVLKAQGR